MDVLRPQIIQIGDRFYRKNPTLQRDVTADEEEEFNWQNGDSKFHTSNFIELYVFCFLSM